MLRLILVPPAETTTARSWGIASRIQSRQPLRSKRCSSGTPVEVYVVGHLSCVFAGAPAIGDIAAAIKCRPLTCDGFGIVHVGQGVRAGSTSTILAPGAMAWAHSMSSELSKAQPAFGGGVVQAPLPLAYTLVKLGGAGMPKFVSKVARSEAAVGLSKASTMTIAPHPPVGCLVRRSRDRTPCRSALLCRHTP